MFPQYMPLKVSVMRRTKFQYNALVDSSNSVIRECNQRMARNLASVIDLIPVRGTPSFYLFYSLPKESDTFKYIAPQSFNSLPVLDV